MTETDITDINVAIISADPYFMFACRALLGRDKETRILHIIPSIAEFRSIPDPIVTNIDVLVCDLDSVESIPDFYHALIPIVNQYDYKVLGLATGSLPKAASTFRAGVLHGFLEKNDLGFCLHLAIRAVYDYDILLLTKASAAALPQGVELPAHPVIIGDKKKHPDLKETYIEVAELRIFIGLDNADIHDELLLADATVRGYMHEIYSALNVNGVPAADREYAVFKVLSDWWWQERFAPFLKRASPSAKFRVRGTHDATSDEGET